MAAFLICIFSGGASFDSSFSHTFPFDHCLIMRDLSAYTITYTQLSEHKHIHMWKVTTVLCLTFTIWGAGRVGRPSDIFVCYISNPATSFSGFSCAAFILLFLASIGNEYTVVSVGQGNYHIRFSGD